jgi:hypothetical protein
MPVLPFAPTGGHARVAALDLLDKDFIFALFPVSPSSRSEADQTGSSTLLTGLASGVARISVGAMEAAVGICTRFPTQLRKTDAPLAAAPRLV